MSRKLTSSAALFAGAGALELGLQKSGIHAELFADLDPAARAVLEANFPGLPVEGDVGRLRTLPPVGLVTAGFPCQDLSMAGTKKGLSGAKSSAVDHLFELLADSRVPAVLVENVYFMLHLDRGAAMDSLVRRFEQLGYQWAYRVVDSMAFGLPQRRRRVFFLALQDGEPGASLFADDAGLLKLEKPDLTGPIGFYWTEGFSGNGLTKDAIPPLKAGSGIGLPSTPAVLFPGPKVVRPTIQTAETLQGLPCDWTQAAEGVGKPGSRWRLVGNAVSVPVAAWLGKRLLCPGPILGQNHELSSGAPWPKACFGQAGRRWQQTVSEFPEHIAKPSLADFDEDDWVTLSPRALSGFIRRARASPLRYPEGFLAELEKALQAIS